jgi:WhiB family redox-sensing transcriptional regulator
MKTMPSYEPEIVTWREFAACQDVTNVDFFPSPEDVGAIGAAKAICASCPVVEECLSYALETRQTDGIWGGQTPKERTKLRRKWMEGVRRAS